MISGCFTLFSVEKLKEIGLYDDHYFMYFEDWDISRRMHLKYKTVYFPEVSVVTRKQKYSENGNRGTAKSGTRIR